MPVFHLLPLLTFKYCSSVDNFDQISPVSTKKNSCHGALRQCSHHHCVKVSMDEWDCDCKVFLVLIKVEKHCGFKTEHFLVFPFPSQCSDK